MVAKLMTKTEIHTFKETYFTRDELSKVTFHSAISGQDDYLEVLHMPVFSVCELIGGS
jgi:hypothetical protein